MLKLRIKLTIRLKMHQNAAENTEAEEWPTHSLVNGYVFLACVCGLKLKFPPGFKRSQVKCPKCGRQHKVPLAELAAVNEAINAK